MKTAFFLCLILLAAGAAHAAPVDERFCAALVRHRPSADVAYQAGVDVQGNAVAAADLPAEEGGASPLKLPEEITIPLTADLMHFLKLTPASLPAAALARNDIPLGTLTLRGNDVFFNGQPLTDAQQDNLDVLCLKPTK